jgi:hypothetical protein
MNKLFHKQFLESYRTNFGTMSVRTPQIGSTMLCILAFVLFSAVTVFAENGSPRKPTTSLSAKDKSALTGSVYIQNNSNCTITVYCYEANGAYAGQTFTMFTLGYGQSNTVYPSASSGQVYCRVGNTTTSSVTFTGGYHTLYNTSCGVATSCNVNFTNTGCQTAELFWNDNGTLRSYGHIAGNSTKSQSSFSGHAWVMKVGNTTVGNYTVNCGSPNYSFNAGGTRVTPHVTITQPTCTNPKGTVVINNLPNGYWSFIVGGTPVQGRTVIDNLNPGTYRLGIGLNGCDGFTDVVINNPPTTPTPQVTVTQPTCANPKGKIDITNLPNGYYSRLVNVTWWAQNLNWYGNLSPGTYEVEIGSGGCNKSVHVTINQPPAIVTPQVTVTQPTCTNPKGRVVINNLPNGYWSFIVGQTPVQGRTVIDNLNPGTYRLGIGLNGCDGFTDVVINNPPNSVNGSVSGNLSVCNGGTTTLTASGGTSYRWSNGSTAPSVTVGAGTYTVTVTNGSCSGVWTKTVTSTSLNATISGDLSVCDNGRTTLTAGGGGPNATYRWSSTSQNISGTTSQSISGGAGTYTVTVSDGSCSTTRSVTVTSTSLNLTVSGNTSVCNGNTTALTASVAGNNASYQWSNGVSGATITVGAGTYTVTATKDGCTATRTVTVTSTALNASVSGNTSVCNGNTTTLTASGGSSYQWSNGVSGATVTVGAGTYTVTISDGSCSTTRSVTVTSNSLNLTVSGNTGVCNGNTTALTASVAGNNASYQWSNGVSGATITVGAGTYTVTATKDGCTATRTVTVTSNSLNASISGNTSVCNGNTTTLTASGGSSYQWSNGVSGQTVTVGAGTYTVTVSDGACSTTRSVTVTSGSLNLTVSGNTSVCNGNTTTLTASGGTSYQWSNGVNGQTVTVGAGTYVVTATSNGCTATQTVTVTSVAPTLTLSSCPANITVTAAQGTTCAQAHWTAPTATATCGTPSVNSNYQPGHCFPIGTTTVTYTATLNGQTKTCSFTVTVIQNQPQLGSIGDFTFCDNNANGIFDNGDTPLSNILVTLCNSAGQTITTATTNATGNYSFGNLAAATYIVKFPATTTDGKALTTAASITVNLTAGQNFLNADAGYKPASQGSIGDFVFMDQSGNGIFDNGDMPQGGVTVTLCDVNGNTISTNTTGSNGQYLFSGLGAAVYIVKFPATSPDGKTLTTQGQVVVNLGAGQNNLNVDAGYKPATQQLGSIGDLTFADNNNNGVFDNGDTPLSNVTVTLCNASGQTITTATTGTNGIYTFTGLAAGTYIVKFPATTTDGRNITTQQQITVNLSAGQNFVNADAGYYKQNGGSDVCTNPTANIVGGSGSIAVTGISTGVAVVMVMNNQWQTVYNQQVNSSSVTIPNLPAGSYMVKVTVLGAGGSWPAVCEKNVNVNVTTGGGNTCPDGSPKKTPGTACNDNNPNTTNDVIQADGCSCAGTTSQQTGSIGDLTFADNNNNGVFDAGDAPLSNVTVTLCNASGQTITTATTGTNGIYTFTGLAAGTYIVKFPATTADGRNITTQPQITVNLSAGQNFVNADAGYYKQNGGGGGNCVRDLWNAKSGNNPNGNRWVDTQNWDDIGVSLPGLYAAGQFTSFRFLQGAKFTENADGTAKITGVIQDFNNPTRSFVVNINFTGRTSVGTPYNLVQAPSTADWYYYTWSTATLTGQDALAGAVLNMTGRGGPFQVGSGANQVWNADDRVSLGGGGWFSWTVVSQPWSGNLQLLNYVNGDADVVILLPPCPTTNLASTKSTLELAAAAELHQVRVNWVNNTGKTVDFFEVERLNQTTGNFENLTTANARFSDNMEHYVFFDANPTEGENVYQVTMTALDGKKQNSNLQTVKFSKTLDFRVFPNPASDYIDVDLKQYEGKSATLYLYDNFGKLMMTQQVEQATNLPVHLDLNGKASGTYLLRVTSEGRKDAVKKFMIQQ